MQYNKGKVETQEEMHPKSAVRHNKLNLNACHFVRDMGICNAWGDFHGTCCIIISAHAWSTYKSKIEKC